MSKWIKDMFGLGMVCCIAFSGGCQPRAKMARSGQKSAPASMSVAPASLRPIKSTLSAELANEWRQPGANSSYSRSLFLTLSPPLHVIWRIPIPFVPDSNPYVPDQGIVAAGENVYLQGSHGTFQKHFLDMMAVDAKNGSRRWLVNRPEVHSSSAFLGPVATDRGVITGWNGHLDYLDATDGSNILKTDTGLYSVCGLIGNRLYFLPHPDGSEFQVTNPDSFQTLDVDTLQLGPITALSIPGSGSYGYEPNNPRYGHMYFFPERIATLDIGGSPAGKVSLFMQDLQNVVTTEGAPTYHPHVLVDVALNNGPAVGGGGHAYQQFAAGDYVSLRSINPTGKIAWLHRFPKKYRNFYGSRFSYDALATTSARVFALVGSVLYALDARTGRVAWTAKYQRPLSAPGSGPVVMGNVLYILTSSIPFPKGSADSIQAYSVSTGRLLWSSRIGHWISTFIGHRGALYLVDNILDPHDSSRSDAFLLKLSSAKH